LMAEVVAGIASPAAAPVCAGADAASEATSRQTTTLKREHMNDSSSVQSTQKRSISADLNHSPGNGNRVTETRWFPS
jgi:hypothetical protein